MSHNALHRSIGPGLIPARVNAGLVVLAQFPILFGRQPPELCYTAHFVISSLDGVLSYQPFHIRAGERPTGPVRADEWLEVRSTCAETHWTSKLKTFPFIQALPLRLKAKTQLPVRTEFQPPGDR